MVREYRVRVYQNMVLLVLPSLKPDHGLLCRTVVAAEETPALCNVSLVQLGCRRNDSRRIELQFHCKSSGIHVSDLYILQGPEVITRKRPA